MTRRLLYILLMFLVSNVLSAQFGGTKLDAPKKKKDGVPRSLKVWNIDKRYGMADTTVIDSAITSYQDNQPVNNYSIANAWTGNIGSPLESKIYFDRTSMSVNMFSRAYDAYILLPNNLDIYDTKMPISNLTYRTATTSYREEDNLKVMLAMNANKHLNVGGLCNFIYGRGQYNNQSTNMLNGGFWTSYYGKQYEFNAMVLFNDFKVKENGGVSNMEYILNPEDYGGVIDAENVPVNMTNAQSMYRNFNYFYNHKYSLGVKRAKTLDNDSVVYEFVPVTSFIHTIQMEDVRRKYVEVGNANTGFYENTYISDKYTKDSLSHFSLKNTFAVTLDEKFNKLLKFGLAAYVDYEVSRYAVGFDSVLHQEDLYHDISVGGVLSKSEGKYVRYNVNGSVYVFGSHLGEFDVNGNIDTEFKIGKRDTMQISASAGLKYFSTYTLYGNYNSNHFRWQEQFDNTWQMRFAGRIAFPQRNISIGFNMENNSNYVYLGKKATPEQYNGAVTILAVDAKVNLKAWYFHLDNQVVYQYTDVPDVVRLPDLALYSNLYFKNKFFNVLTTQIGVSVRFHTAYYANRYMPAIGQFYLQDDMLVGNYPELNVYANFHLKTVRFYVQYYHWNKGLFPGLNNYFSMPNYPINPATLQLGLSWNFWG